MRLSIKEPLRRWIMNALDINDDRLYEALTKGLPSMSAAGIPITEENAMKFSAVYGCVSLLAGTIASLPIKVFEERTGRAGFQKEITGTRLNTILNRSPAPTMTAYVFWETIAMNLFLAGNAYALIARTLLGDPKYLIWLPAQHVTPKFNEKRTRILYGVSLPSRTATYDMDDILHFPCIGWDGLTGMSPIKAATEGIGLGLAGEKYNAHFFTNSITSDIGLIYEKPMTPDAKRALEEYLEERYSKIENLRKPFVGTGLKDIKNLGMSASDAQMIEARDYQVEDICRFYNVPPFMVGAMKKNTSFGAGLTEQTQGFVKFTARKHLKRIEQEIDRKLIRNPKRYCKFNLDALLRADIKTRNEAYKVALGGNQMPAYMTPNEVRRIEGFPPDQDPASDRVYSPPAIPGVVEEEETETADET